MSAEPPEVFPPAAFLFLREKTMRRLIRKFLLTLLSILFVLFIGSSFFHSSPFSSVSAQTERAPLPGDLPANFNHDATSFPLLGAHKNLTCAQCHLGGKYKSLPTACENCHNGQIAYGKPRTHVMTSQSCNACHQLSGWIPATFRHDPATATGQCATCHNGQTAEGKPQSHIVTTQQCDTCHKTSGWIPATFRHDLAAVTGQCSTCHNGQKATGKPPNHLATTQQCDTCHKTTGWIPATFRHDLATVTGQCATCHNGQRATGKPQSHLATTLQCDTCHKITGWIPATYPSHDNPRLIGAHTPLECKVCHTQSFSTAFYRDGTQYGSCANCHSRDYKYPGPPEHRNAGATLADSLRANATCSNCHKHAGYRGF
jgi:hypothetical protein